MKRRSGKYLNAREYAERLRLSDNKDIQDFAEEFIDALDAYNTDGPQKRLDEIEEKIAEYTENLDEGTSLERLKWLNNEAETLAELEEKIHETLPEFKEVPIEDIIDALVKLKQAAIALQPKPAMAYDL